MARRNSSASSSGNPNLADTLPVLRTHDPTAAYLVEQHHPVFDFDNDSCFPAAMISRTGELNKGLEPGSKDPSRPPNFMDLSNTYHRYDSRVMDGVTYHAHMYDLYFQKDETGFHGIGDHRHDIETVFMMFRETTPLFVGVSAHGGYTVEDWANVPQENGHPKVVYHKHGIRTHALRFAQPNEEPENPTGRFCFPPLASWFFMAGEGGFTNGELRRLLNTHSFGKASLKIKDGSCKYESDKIQRGTPIFGFARGSLFYDEPIGAQEGSKFDDGGVLRQLLGDESLPIRVKKIELRAGRRVDCVKLTMADGTVFQHGGSGGTPQTLALEADEYITHAEVYQGKKSNKTRIFRMSIHTNKNRSITGGSTAGATGPHTIGAPDDATGTPALVGFHGFGDSELDRVGGIFMDYFYDMRASIAHGSTTMFRAHL